MNVAVHLLFLIAYMFLFSIHAAAVSKIDVSAIQIKWKGMDFSVTFFSMDVAMEQKVVLLASGTSPFR